jgi:hypothetical protein
MTKPRRRAIGGVHRAPTISATKTSSTSAGMRDSGRKVGRWPAFDMPQGDRVHRRQAPPQGQVAVQGHGLRQHGPRDGPGRSAALMPVSPAPPYPCPRMASSAARPARSAESAECMEASSSCPLALVTGASSGIGCELAKQFAANGFDIVAAEDEAIFAAARKLRRLAPKPTWSASTFTCVAPSTSPSTSSATCSTAARGRSDRDVADAGPSATALFERADMLATKVGASDSTDGPADVACDGFDGGQGARGRQLAFNQASSREPVLPDDAKAGTHRRIAEPGSGKQGAHADFGRRGGRRRRPPLLDDRPTIRRPCAG